ncbi:hypothetical protein CIPAW_10G161300 [Carya illinoinensis]|uniref:Uncharacterized protein n=1 Tax=Carya illinoinensis TaxID=32201 RepID=A0A8T1PDY5_CARIL|nr:hypothetical protein CIPAW_10G161300 [Carya illinoinensis]
MWERWLQIEKWRAEKGAKQQCMFVVQRERILLRVSEEVRDHGASFQSHSRRVWFSVGIRKEKAEQPQELNEEERGGRDDRNSRFPRIIETDKLFGVCLIIPGFFPSEMIPAREMP